LLTKDTSSLEDNTSPTFLGQVLGATRENCTQTSWWWILLPAFLALLGVLHLVIGGKIRAVFSILLFLAAGAGLYFTNCGPWLWIGLSGLVTLMSVASSLNTARAPKTVPFASVKRSTG